MVALGWMNILWMVLFTAIIVAERVWNRGIWIARSAGVGFAIVGIMVMLGLISIDLGMDMDMNSDMDMDMNSGMDINSSMDMGMSGMDANSS